MKVVLQVVDSAKVEVEGKLHNSIGTGYLLLVGINKEDTLEKVKEMAVKISKLRVFKDEAGKTNLNIYAVKGEILSISQFTLCANTTGTNRPDFFHAAPRDMAISLYETFNEELRKCDLIVKDGVFGEEMIVTLTHHGPFTLTLEL
jgi:D-tyrosyl-tRNA(Tyr) deacylase